MCLARGIKKQRRALADSVKDVQGQGERAQAGGIASSGCFRVVNGMYADKPASFGAHTITVR